MVDRSRFPDSLLTKLRSADFDGRLMTNVSREILLIDYSDNEYDRDFFSIFNLIVDEENDGNADYGEIEAVYKNSFLNAIAEFRAFFDI